MYRTSKEAETAFYAAFEAADLARMMAVWDEDDNIVCVHPMGARLQGRHQVAQSWQRIFRQGAAMRFRISDLQRTADDGVAVHVLHENISLDAREGKSIIIATNVYRRTPAGWRMVLHHASPMPLPQEVPPRVVH
jgi:ketosteroid isomerase-like protein